MFCHHIHLVRYKVDPQRSHISSSAAIVHHDQEDAPTTHAHTTTTTNAFFSKPTRLATIQIWPDHIEIISARVSKTKTWSSYYSTSFLPLVVVASTLVAMASTRFSEDLFQAALLQTSEGWSWPWDSTRGLAGLRRWHLTGVGFPFQWHRCGTRSAGSGGRTFSEMDLGSYAAL